MFANILRDCHSNALLLLLPGGLFGRRRRHRHRHLFRATDIFVRKKKKNKGE